jgi:hypothetical protein
MKAKSLVLFAAFLGLPSMVVGPQAKAEEFLCTAQKNAYNRAVAAFNASPSASSAFAVAQAQAAYFACTGLNSTPGG